MNKRIRHLAAVGACVALCVVYILLAGSAVSQKSATYDEPMHVVAGWRMLWRDEYGFNADQPPLWQYWIALPLPKDALNYDATPTSLSPDLRAIDALYRIPPAAGIELVKRARGMCLPLAVALGVLIAVWAGRLAGGVAAVAALFAFALDPNWLAHGPLAKNDVALSLAFVATAYATWRLGQRACPATVAAVLLLPAICLAIKLSGVLATPIVAICLLARTVMPTAWIAGGRRRAVLLAAAICLGIAVVDYAAIWAEYRFQWQADVDVPAALRALQFQQVRAAVGNVQPTPEQLAAWRPSRLIRCVLWMEDHRLLPQAWVDLFIHFRANDSGTYQAFLLGEIYDGGRWSYLPLVWLFKEPLAVILAAVLSVCAAFGAMRRLTWTGVVFLVAAILYAAVIVGGNLNVGIRYLLPILAMMDIGIGVEAAKGWQSGRLVARFLILLLAAGLAVESLRSYPDYIAFFNVACGGERGGIRLLANSNLDWGQDLPLLKKWQDGHPGVALYLDYFGTCDPRAYGIRYVNVVNRSKFASSDGWPTSPGVAAISASRLQGWLGQGWAGDFAAAFRHARPLAVLGGSIYLFRYPP